MIFTFLLVVFSFQFEIHTYWLSTQYRVPISFWQFNTVNGQFLLDRFTLSYSKEVLSGIGVYIEGNLLYSAGDTLSIHSLSMDFRENKMKYFDTTRKEKRWLIRTLIQRGYISYRVRRLNILLGRFLPTQGYGYFYSPTDVYKTRQKLSIDPEFLRGIDAFEATMYPVPHWKIRVLVPFEYENKPVSFISVFLLKNLEIFIALNRESPGFGFSLPLFDGLIRSEIARSNHTTSWDWTYDRFFQSDVYVLVEVLRTSDISFTGLPLITGEEEIGITSLFVRKGFSSGTSLELTIMVSNKDRSSLWMPRISHEINDYLAVEGRVYVSMGKRGALFDPFWFLPVITLGLGAYF